MQRVKHYAYIIADPNHSPERFSHMWILKNLVIRSHSQEVADGEFQNKAEDNRAAVHAMTSHCV